MKCTIPEISWHNREPVLSVDIYPISSDFYRLATGGGDSHVVLWQMTISDNGAVKQDLLSDLTRHQRAVNCVRWSHNGQYLASADDDANIIVWQLKTDNIPLLEGETGDKEIWIVYKVLRGHKEDVYDLCWSVDDSKLFSGSVDNTAILWDIGKGKLDHILTDHKGFVQGVTWDPKNQIIATISTDRTCRIFDPTGKHVKARIQKGKLNVSEDHHFYDLEVKFLHDDTFKSFFRRLDFTPDGSLLVVPSGRLETDNCRALNATLVFKLDNWHMPAVVLPIPHQSSTVVRCCPVLFEQHDEGPEPYINLPYRMIFAVGTDHDIILYDTQQVMPFARFQEIHYTRVTDLTWSHDGLLLVASSTDGFCSLITFEPDELGVPYIAPEPKLNESVLDISNEDLEKDENVDETNKEKVIEKVKERESEEEKKKRSSFLLQWAQNPAKKPKLRLDQKSDNNEVIEIKDSPVKKDEVNILIPKRVVPIKLNESKPETEVINKLTPKKINENDTKTEETNEETKKRPSFLKQWAQNTPKRKKLEDDELQNKSNGLEPQDGEKKEKINILTPRRITPKKIGDVQKPVQDKGGEKIDALVPKRITPITLESKEGSSSTNSKNCDTYKEESEPEEELTEEEQKEYQVASKDIQAFFCRSSNSTNSTTISSLQSDAKPIAVRRKPKEQDNSHCDEKPVIVKRKPIEDKKEKVEGSKQFSISKEEKNSHRHAQPIAVKRKPIEKNKEKADDSRQFLVPDSNLTVNAKNSKTSESKDILETHQNGTTSNKQISDTVKEENVAKTTPVRRKLELFGDKEIKDKKSSSKIDDDVICLDLDDEKDSKPAVKVKISALVSKKKDSKESIVTLPQKKNALLNFLQKSTEKQKKTKKKKEVSKIDTSVDVTIEENEARDAWCDDKDRRRDIKEKESVTKIEIDDDRTEDFCLHLEDSQDSADNELKPIDLVENDRNKDIEGKDKNHSEELNSCKKTPRRVPLITVASPKNKVMTKKV